LREKELPISLTRHVPIELLGTDNRKAGLDELRGKPVAGFCGIGNPEAFRRTLEDLGSVVTAFRSYRDHHNYTRADVDELRAWAEKQPADAFIATTQKDFVKLRIAELAGRPLWAVRIGLAFVEGQASFEELLKRLI
jgi:tetraacyldisaccharide 4'-kinase